MTRLEEVLGDLEAEGEQLDSFVASLTEDQWREPTVAPGWDTATQIAHLAWTDEIAVTAATDRTRWDALLLDAISDPDGYADAQARQIADGTSCPDLLERWRQGRHALAATLRGYPDGGRLPWFGPPMSPTSMGTARLMETWAHGLDVFETFGVAPAPVDRVRHVVFLGAVTRGFAFASNGLEPPAVEVRVELVLPSGAVFAHGDPQAADRVTGSGYDFARLVTRRARRDDLDLVATGPVADRWLDIAQAFAGPAGAGRSPNSPPNSPPNNPPRGTDDRPWADR